MIVATGWKPYDAAKLDNLGFGKSANVVTNVMLERMAAMDGPSGGKLEIGLRNVEYGRQLLASRQIALIAEHVGGSGRRKLHFDLWSGDAWLAFPQGFDAHIRSPYG